MTALTTYRIDRPEALELYHYLMTPLVDGVKSVGFKGLAQVGIDLETASVVILAVPSFVILWKAVQDDGAVNWVETSTMIAIFGLVIYFLAVHG